MSIIECKFARESIELAYQRKLYGSYDCFHKHCEAELVESGNNPHVLGGDPLCVQVEEAQAVVYRGYPGLDQDNRLVQKRIKINEGKLEELLKKFNNP